MNFPMNWTFWTRTPPTGLDDCGTIDPLLSLYADGMADAGEARRVEAHLPDCAACRESLAWMRATRRALSSRPVVAPPADLRDRIASAIAASDAAPVPVFSARPARAFALRPALAAAASIAFLGVLSYGLMHQEAPPVVHPVQPPQVAVAPSISPLAPPVSPASVPGVKPVAHHSVSQPKHTDFDPDLVAANTPPKVVSHAAAIKTHPTVKDDAEKMADAAPVAAQVKFAVAPIKKLTPRKSYAGLLAMTKVPTSSPETHRPLTIKHENGKPETVVATVPHTPTISAPALIEKTPIITPDPVPTVVAASNNGGGRFQTAEEHGRIRLNLALGNLGTFSHATVSRIDKGAVSASRTISPDGVYIDGIHSR